MADWALQDARKNFSAVVDAALEGTPQRITRRGKPAVVILSFREFERLRHLEKAQTPTFGELLVAIPRDDGEFHELELTPRSVDT